MNRLGILAGSFNPPTIAHLELVRAALQHVDEVLCVLPRVFPHKEYFGATLDQRVKMVETATAGLPCATAVTDRGLFIDIARECRTRLRAPVRLYFLCGADAAERIVNWDYGAAGFAERMFCEFELLVAPRGFGYQPPVHLRDRVHPLPMEGHYHDVSSTEVRGRISRGEPWEHLVPASIADLVRSIYS